MGLREDAERMRLRASELLAEAATAERKLSETEADRAAERERETALPSPMEVAKLYVPDGGLLLRPFELAEIVRVVRDAAIRCERAIIRHAAKDAEDAGDFVLWCQELK